MSGLLYEDLGYGAPFLLTAAVNVLFFVAAIFLVPSSAGRQKEDPPSSSSSPEDCKSSSPLVKLLKRRRLWLAIGIEVWAQVIIGYMDSAVPVCMLQVRDTRAHVRLHNDPHIRRFSWHFGHSW